MNDWKTYLQYTNLVAECFKSHITKAVYRSSYAVSALVIASNIYSTGSRVHKENLEKECPLQVKNCQGCKTNGQNRLFREVKDQAAINIVPTFFLLPLYTMSVAKFNPIVSLATTPFMIYKLDNFMIDFVNVIRLTRKTSVYSHLQNGDPQLKYKWPETNF